MIGVIIGDMAAWTWEHDKDSFYKRLASPDANLSGYGLLLLSMWQTINEGGLQVVYRDGSIWCSQKAMAQLFDVGVTGMSNHLKNIFEMGKLVEDSVISKMETTITPGY